MRSGDEEQCKQELSQLFDTLKTFTDMSLVVTLCVNSPFPQLSDLLSFIRNQYGFIRVLIVSLERSPKEIVQSIQNNET